MCGRACRLPKIAAVSYDVYFWKSASAEANDVCDQLADEEVDSVEPSPDILRFREQLLTRWPELADHISPWSADLGWRQPWGRKDLAPYFVALTLSFSTDETTLRAMIDLADTHTLITYDPQIGAIVQ